MGLPSVGVESGGRGCRSWRAEVGWRCNSAGERASGGALGTGSAASGRTTGCAGDGCPCLGSCCGFAHSWASAGAVPVSGSSSENAAPGTCPCTPRCSRRHRTGHCSCRCGAQRCVQSQCASHCDRLARAAGKVWSAVACASCGGTRAKVAALWLGAYMQLSTCHAKCAPHLQHRAGLQTPQSQSLKGYMEGGVEHGKLGEHKVREVLHGFGSIRQPLPLGPQSQRV